jgi:hypothetical protein
MKYEGCETHVEIGLLRTQLRDVDLLKHYYYYYCYIININQWQIKAYCKFYQHYIIYATL